MLKIQILSIGKDKDRWIGEGCDHYLKLLSRYARAEIMLVPSLKDAASLSPDEIKSREAERLMKARGSSYLIALHDRAERFDSVEFSRKLDRLQTESGGKVTFVVGGAFGLDNRVLAQADLVLSLSELTISHQLARLALLEQLYRAYTIIHGTAYHK